MQIRNPFASKSAVPPVPVAATSVPDPTHVLVPVDLLRAIHDTLHSHADAVRALLPASADPEADVAARTAARLKRQGA